MTFIRFKKFGKQEYAYQIQTLWNKQTQKPYQKSKYLGVVINKEKSIFERKNSFKSEKSILDFGDSYITRDCLEKTGFVSLIETVFGDKSKSLLALISYKLCYGSAMMYASKWLEGNFANLQYKDVNLSSQRISELFKYLGEESLQRIFFKKYLLDFVQAKNGIIIDVTSLPNQIHIPLSVWGLRGEEIDKQIRLLLVVDKETHYPLMFRILPGNIVDVSTLENTLEELKKYDVKINSICMDAGFFSENNIKEMYERNIPFLTRMPSTRVIYKQLIEEEMPKIESVKNAIRYGKRGLFIKQREIDLFGRTAFAYVVLDPQRKGRETSKLLLETFDEKEQHNEKEMDYSLMKKGVMILISSENISRQEIVSLYYLRQTAENLFGFSKADLNLLPLRVHSEETLRGFLLIQFLSLIAFIQLRNKLNTEFTVEEALLIMRNLKCKVYDKEILVGELTKQQKQIAEKFNILMPKRAGI